MPIVLFRVDERLLHGQVLVGWGARLGIRLWAVVDDEIAKSDWEQELYAAGLSEDAGAVFLSVDGARDRIEELEARRERSAVLTRDTASMRRLAEAGLLDGRGVNVGGLHAGPERRRAVEYAHLGAGEVEDLVAIREVGATVTARDLPTSSPLSLEELLDAAGWR